MSPGNESSESRVIGTQLHFVRPDGTPLADGHHLSLGPRGKFVFRATVDRGPKLVGERIAIPLRTDDPRIAAKIRDGILEALQRSGVLCREVMIPRENVCQKVSFTDGCSQE